MQLARQRQKLFRPETFHQLQGAVRWKVEERAISFISFVSTLIIRAQRVAMICCNQLIDSVFFWVSDN